MSGHDFRPDYAKLGTLRKLFSETPVLALTATANSAVRSDVIRILCIENKDLGGYDIYDAPNAYDDDGDVIEIDVVGGIGKSRGAPPPYALPPKVFLGDFDRPNLYFAVWPKPKSFDDSIELLTKALPTKGEGAAIVYCLTQSK
jgi:superfamily II DNA helicase RecQ